MLCELVQGLLQPLSPLSDVADQPGRSCRDTRHRGWRIACRLRWTVARRHQKRDHLAERFRRHVIGAGQSVDHRSLPIGGVELSASAFGPVPFHQVRWKLQIESGPGPVRVCRKPACSDFGDTACVGVCCDDSVHLIAIPEEVRSGPQRIGHQNAGQRRAGVVQVLHRNGSLSLPEGLVRVGRAFGTGYFDVGEVRGREGDPLCCCGGSVAEVLSGCESEGRYVSQMMCDFALKNRCGGCACRRPSLRRPIPRLMVGVSLVGALIGS